MSAYAFFTDPIYGTPGDPVRVFNGHAYVERCLPQTFCEARRAWPPRIRPLTAAQVMELQRRSTDDIAAITCAACKVLYTERQCWEALVTRKLTYQHPDGVVHYAEDVDVKRRVGFDRRQGVEHWVITACGGSFNFDENPLSDTLVVTCLRCMTTPIDPRDR